MLRDFFAPELKEDQRPIIAQCRHLSDALTKCSLALEIIPKDYRLDLADAISTIADTYAMMNKIHNDYMIEFGRMQGPAKHQ